MSSTLTNCPHCNAPVHGPFCQYCGTQVAPDLNFEQQKEAIEAYHRLLTTEDESRRVTLLRNGFLPDDPRILIEAGLQCVPLVDCEGERQVKLAAAGRLKAVISKLGLMPGNPGASRAIAELSVKIQEYEKREAHNLLAGLGIVFIGVLILGGVVFALYQVLF